jgi:hypothetical protein
MKADETRIRQGLGEIGGWPEEKDDEGFNLRNEADKKLVREQDRPQMTPMGRRSRQTRGARPGLLLAYKIRSALRPPRSLTGDQEV